MFSGKLADLFGRKNSNTGDLTAGRDIRIGDDHSQTTNYYGLSKSGYKAGLREDKQRLSDECQILMGMPIIDEKRIHVLNVALRGIEEKLANIDDAHEVISKDGNELGRLLWEEGHQQSNDKAIAAIKPLAQGNMRQADTVLAESIAREESNIAKKYFWRSKIAASHFNLDKQRQFVAKAVELAPANPEYLEAAANVEMDFDLKKAVLYTQQLASILRQIYAGQPLLLADKLHDHARKLEGIGHYSEAIVLAEDATASLRKEYGNNNPKIAGMVWHQAVLYRKQSRLQQAEPLFREAIDLYRSSASTEEDKDSLASALNSFAVLLARQGRYQEEEPFLQEALSIWKKIKGENHPGVATILNNLAGLYRSQGRYDEAKPLYQRDLAISEKVLGKDHPEVATTLSNLAGLFRQQGRYDEAEPLHQRSLAIREKKLGKDHPKVAATLNNLAVLYESQGRYDEAEPLFQRAISINRASLGKHHPHTQIAIRSLRYLRDTIASQNTSTPSIPEVTESRKTPENPYAQISRGNMNRLDI